MTDRLSIACTAFEGPRLLAAGPLSAVALTVKAAGGGGLVFEDSTGRVIDLDLRGSDAEVLARLQPPVPEAPRGRGRPKLGVTAREVTVPPTPKSEKARGG